MKTWTTKDLLYKTFEFKGMVPNTNEWNEKSLKFNKPRLIRFKRINALLKAFQLIRTEEQKNTFWTILKGNKKVKEGEITQNEIIPFLRGDFINKRESVTYPNIQTIIENEKAFESDSFKPRDISQFYRHLMKYRIEINNILHHNSGVLEASSLGFRSAISLTNEMNNELYKKVETIDQMLLEIINPENLTFNEDILINEYGFPKEDLNAIDMDNY